MIKKILFGLSLLLAINRLPAFGQRENSNWFFGINAAINFPATGAPAAVAGSAMNTYEATTAVSDAAGQLLFYSNSENIWNRNHQVMPNGANLGGHQSASQGVIAVQSLTNAQQYYVFVVDGAENQLVGGLKYSLVDMTQQGGLGAVTTRSVQVSSVRLTEKLTTVPHANGRDTWVLVHGWQTNAFYAYLLSASGLQTAPVVTNIGSVHSGGGGTYGNANSVGYLRASPNGSKLAVGVRDASFELFDFNPATGQLSNYIPLGPTSRSYGVAFSPDSRLLYGTNLNYLQVYQFDTQAGSASAVANSGMVVANTADNSGGLQMGPDGKLYVSINNSAYLAVINNPNVRGTGCGFQASAVYLGGKTSQIGLPNFPASRVAAAGSATAPPALRASFIPNIITPNGDQQNDFFVLKGLMPSEWSLRIFDRWGRPVYDQPRYDNRWNADGQSEGLYYYILLHSPSGERHQGWVEVVRGS